jgi:pimeloyl-ACP methyl ester carboxylesterase/membrane protein DedA with SNARE-associated domain
MKRVAHGLFWTYLGVLALSHLVAWWRPAPEPTAGMRAVEVRVPPSAEARSEELVTIAFHEVASAAADAPVILLLHGSPFASDFMGPLRDALASSGSFRLLVPDLPGFGASERELPEYSARAHAGYALALLDALEVESAHVVGYSMGGAVAIEMASRQPERVASLSLLSALGVEEYELFGRHELNRSVHWLQWALLTAVEWGVPHFGYFERQPVNTEFARNFLDTDQRPLRGMLERWDGPTLIVHGQQDTLVPIQAAREHARLVPQAELRLMAGGHALVYRAPARVAEELAAFVGKVEGDGGVTRSAAAAERLVEAAKPFARDRSWRYVGMAAALVFVLLMAATLVSEDLTCIGAGFLVANGLISLPQAVLACFLGIVVGDLMLYWAGRRLGRPALRRRPLRWVVSEAAERHAEAWFRERGAIIILISRFLPGTRAATYFTAGVVRAPFGKFLLFFGLAAALWTPLLVTLASKLGERMLGWYEDYEVWALPGLVAAALLLYGLIEYGIPLLSWRGRRLLLGKWRRLTRWEYWPLWVMNAPVFLYVCGLVFLRYRRPTAFTLCNPGIPHGGFLGESKSAILAAFPAEADFMLPWAACPAGEGWAERRLRFGAFQERLEHPWPIVIKPDEGQRGLGVHIVRDLGTAESLLRREEVSWILQAYAPGREYGIFYYRFPGEERGQVPSVTTKVMTAVTGDGRSNLERLILADPRAVDLAIRFLERFSDRLEEVPAAGERVTLVELGTHARGATFLDGRALLTPALEARIDEIARQFEGFNYGRFDFRVPSEDDLRAGLNLKLLEVNGLTSEQTHIYAPGASLFAAWRTLMGSWHLAIRIGLEHERLHGLQPWPTGRFLAWWWRSHWRQRKLRT